MNSLLHQAAKAAGMNYMSGPQDFWLDDRAYDIEDPALLPLIASRLRARAVENGAISSRALLLVMGLAHDKHIIAAAMQSLGKWTEAQARQFVEGMK